MNSAPFVTQDVILSGAVITIAPEGVGMVCIPWDCATEQKDDASWSTHSTGLAPLMLK